MLSQKGVTIDERDFFKEPFSEAELRELSTGRALSDMFAWRSPSFKAMGLEPGGLSDEDLIRLMLQEPRLTRRPMIQIGDQLFIGGNLKELEKTLERR